jgi:peptidoglycan LD-endopeptidase LytH
LKKPKKFKRIKNILLAVLLILVIGLIIPQQFSMPVTGAAKNSYNQNSFWFYPWDISGTHKGVDIFARQGTSVAASVSGLVINTGTITKGGNIILILGPKWRLHYYAHLKEVKTSRFSWVNRGDIVGLVGTTGNAIGKAPHLHYSIYSVLPYFWRINSGHLGWKKMFFLNPIEYLNEIL